MADELEFGHVVVESFTWFLFVNISILFAMLRHNPRAKWVHLFLSVVIVGLAIGMSAPLLTPGLEDSDEVIQTHMRLGVAAIVFVALQLIMGVTLFLISKLCPQHKQLSIYLRRLHMILGFLTAYYFKIIGLYITYFVFYFLFVSLLCTQFLFTSLFIYLKFFLKPFTLSQDKGQLMTNLKIISSCYPYYGSLGNNVYDLLKIKESHPGGFQLLEGVKNKDLDRYLLGAYSSETNPLIPIPFHSGDALKILGRPIATLNIASPFNQPPQHCTAFRVTKKHRINEKSETHQLHLVRVDQFPLQFIGYSHCSQLGRFRQITKNKSTRLYTAVNFLTSRNRQIMKKMLPYFHDRMEDSNGVMEVEEIGTANMFSSTLGWKKQEEYLPLVIKSYANGEFTSTIRLTPLLHQMYLSEPRGPGLRWEELQPGRIIFIAGGTGLLPFSDIIDLLYKIYAISHQSSFSTELIKNNPILETNCFQEFTFLLLTSFSNLKEIHHITLCQLVQLSKSTWFEVRLKVSGDTSGLLLGNIQFVKEHFQTIIKSEIQKPYQKIFVCGPPKMNQSMHALLSTLGARGKWMIF